MRKYDDRRITGPVLQIIFQPRKLVAAQCAEPVLLDVYHVDQADKMNSIEIKTVPALAFGIFAKTFEVKFSVIAGDIVFARHIKNLFRLYALEQLIERVKF